MSGGSSRLIACGTPDQANARLIAAAPEVFAALEAIIEWGHREDGPYAWEVLDQAKAALAKARGEESR